MVSLLVDVAPRADPDHVDDDIIFVEDDAPVADSEPVGVPSLKLFDIVACEAGSSAYWRSFDQIRVDSFAGSFASVLIACLL
jgi:hypothetical protein